MTRTARSHFLWILGASGFGFTSAFVFGDLLAMPRGWFLVPHVALTTAFLAAYARWSGTDMRRLWTRRWVGGALVAALVGAFLVFTVLHQPASTRPQALGLWGDILWLGVVYGAADGLLLSVLPVIAAWRACKELGWTTGLVGRIGAALLGIAASAFVSGAYHLGYAEFRGPALSKAILGNSIMSTGQVVAFSPIAAVGSHVVMHVAAVLHGAETTVQLPPHRAGGQASVSRRSRSPLYATPVPRRTAP